jgi:hypothetical protein
MAESHVHKQEKSHTQGTRAVEVCKDRGDTEVIQQPPVGPDPNYQGGNPRGGSDPESSES